MGASTPGPSPQEKALQKEELAAQQRVQAQNAKIQTQRLQALKRGSGFQGVPTPIAGTGAIPATPTNLFTTIQNVGTASQASQQFGGTTSSQTLGGTSKLGA